MTAFRRTMLALAGLCLVPLASVLVSALIAGILGCELNEGGANACVVLGADIGGLLSGMFVLGWLALMTLPLLIAVLALWLVVEAWVRWRGHRRTKAQARAAAPGEEA